MSVHKARPNDRPDPTQPRSTVMFNGRGAGPHAEVDGKPLLGGIQNSIVEGQGRTADEEKAKIDEYHAKREETKKAGKELFDDKTGKPKPKDVVFGPKHDADAQSVAPVSLEPAGQASAEEKKKNVEAEKKADNVFEKKADAKPVGVEAPKVEEKK